MYYSVDRDHKQVGEATNLIDALLLADLGDNIFEVTEDDVIVNTYCVSLNKDGYGYAQLLDNNN